MVIKVAIVGATGRQGSGFVQALLSSSDPKYELLAFIRPESVDKPSTADLRKLGVHVVAVDLVAASHEKLASALRGVDTVVSFLPPDPAAGAGQVALADAAKSAGVKRFVLNSWAPAMPPRGVHFLREEKQNILDHVQKIYLPWTWIDIGFWHDVFIPRIPSGRLDHAAFSHKFYIAGDGSTPCAITHTDDVGRYVARVIEDPRTLNRFVFAYGELLTGIQAIDLIQKASGEGVTVFAIDPKALSRAAESKEFEDRPYIKSMAQYYHSAFVRGDNQPEKAGFLGYLDAKELYPEFRPRRLEETVRAALEDTGAVGDNAGLPEEFWASFEEAIMSFKDPS